MLNARNPGEERYVTEQVRLYCKYHETCTGTVPWRASMMVAKCRADVLRSGDKRMWSHATQGARSTALHQLLLRQPGRLLQQVAWGGAAPSDATREPGAFC